MSTTNFPKRTALAQAVAAGSTVKDAAASLGLNYKTAYRWTKEPSFQLLLTQLQAQAVQDALSILTMGLVKSAQTLIELLDEPAPKTRLAAALGLLDRALKLREQAQLETRLAELEATIATLTQKGQ